MKHVKHFEVEGAVPEDRPKNTWDKILRKELQSQGLDDRQVS